MSKRRDVSGDEEALWREVVRDAKPARKKKPVRLAEQLPGAKKAAPKLVLVEREIRAVKAPAQPMAGLASKHTAPITGVDGGTAERLKRGKIEPDAKLDLHGLTQDRAYATLLRFVQRGHDAGYRCLLVITGKGYGKGGDESASNVRGFTMPERSRGGVLRSLVPHWLEQPDVRRMVVGIQAAHARHGGTGALYVYLRRQRAR